MKKYIVIGNPIDHSLSPKLHNFWFKKNNIDAVYKKKKLENNEIESLILDLKKNNINGINVTVPFKKEVIPYLDELSIEATKTQSVNTIYLESDKVVGHNTDIAGFELAIKNLKMDLKNKTVLLLGAGGVVPSLIFALLKMKISELFISNRTKTKADQLKKLFENIEVINWGEIPDVDVVVNATSLGLNNNDKFNLDFSKLKNKFFYDVIYNPKETEFLKRGKEFGNNTENGKLMFIYQAQLAFKLWHNILPEINKETVELLD